MDSPPMNRVLVAGVAAIVHDLVEFSEVDELFQTHLTRWRKKNKLIVCQRRKFDAELAKLWRDEPLVPDPDRDQHWPARRIYSPDRTKSSLFSIPPELDRKLRKYDAPTHRHSLRSLDERQDLSTEESFILLAELHDAAFPKSQLGNATDLIVGVAEAADVLKEGISQVAAQNLAILVERVLDLIEARADSKSRNETGKTLQEIIFRGRETLAYPVTRSRPNFVLPQVLEAVQEAVAKLGSDTKASIEISKPAAEREVFTPARKASRKKKPQGSRVKSDTLIQEVLNSGNSELIGEWVFANEDALAEKCGCSRGTIMKTEFWKKNRASVQQKWNRQNGGKGPKRKSET